MPIDKLNVRIFRLTFVQVCEDFENIHITGIRSPVVLLVSSALCLTMQDQHTQLCPAHIQEQANVVNHEETVDDLCIYSFDFIGGSDG